VHNNHCAVSLPSGKVLVVAGPFNNTAAELYDPVSGSWSSAGILSNARETFAATLVSNRNVLGTGGAGTSRHLTRGASVRPRQNSWSAAASMMYARDFHSSTLLPNGKVLVAGGENNAGGALNFAELYDPAANSWTTTGSLSTARRSHVAVLLPNGKVLVAGG